MLKDIINYMEISPLLGTGGQPEPGQFGDIHAAGYELVINLLPDNDQYKISGEAAIVTSLGMDYIHIPVIWLAPTDQNLHDFFQALQANKGRKIFAHCAMNFRMSAFVFLYRVLVEKVPAEEARLAMNEIWVPYDGWQEFIERNLVQGQL